MSRTFLLLHPVWAISYRKNYQLLENLQWKCGNGRMMKNLHHLHVFCMECFVYIPKQFRKKFDKKSVFGWLVGYLNDKNVYQVYVPSLRKILHWHDIYFKPEWVCTSSVVEVGLENGAVEDVVVEKRQEGDTMLESSQSDKTLEVETKEEFSRNTERPICMVKWPMWMISGEHILLSACTAITGGGDPVSYWEAMKSMQKEEWVMAMKEEMDALMKNDSWELVDCPKNVKVINNHWVLRTKLNADGLTQWFLLAWSWKDMCKRQALIMTRPLALWHAKPQFVLCLQLLLRKGCSYTSLMWRQHFCSAQFRGMCTCVKHRGSMMAVVGCAS